jgi:hypothetical protein
MEMVAAPKDAAAKPMMTAMQFAAMVSWTPVSFAMETARKCATTPIHAR